MFCWNEKCHVIRMKWNISHGLPTRIPESTALFASMLVWQDCHKFPFQGLPQEVWVFWPMKNNNNKNHMLEQWFSNWSPHSHIWGQIHHNQIFLTAFGTILQKALCVTSPNKSDILAWINIVGGFLKIIFFPREKVYFVFFFFLQGKSSQIFSLPYVLCNPTSLNKAF